MSNPRVALEPSTGTTSPSFHLLRRCFQNLQPGSHRHSYPKNPNVARRFSKGSSGHMASRPAKMSASASAASAIAAACAGSAFEAPPTPSVAFRTGSKALCLDELEGLSARRRQGVGMHSIRVCIGGSARLDRTAWYHI